MKSTESFDQVVDDLRVTVRVAARLLRAISEVDAARPLKPAKWSAKQVVGHLIDSASNNHQRFVRAQFEADLAFSGYDQEAWVRAQAHQEAPWIELVDLWEGYNLLLARVMEACPREERSRARSRHNLHEIAWEVVPRDEPATLEYLMRDYVGHLKHHLQQIDPKLASALSAQPGGADFQSG